MWYIKVYCTVNACENDTHLHNMEKSVHIISTGAVLILRQVLKTGFNGLVVISHPHIFISLCRFIISSLACCLILIAFFLSVSSSLPLFLSHPHDTSLFVHHHFLIAFSRFLNSSLPFCLISLYHFLSFPCPYAHSFFSAF